MSTAQHTEAAYQRGVEDAKRAAAWIADGNTDPEHIRRLLVMLESGDPAADDYLPARPNLSGEWADALTPRALFEDVTGLDAHAEATWNMDAYNAYVDELCDAYESGVSDTFQSACQAELRKWLPNDECQWPEAYAISVRIKRDPRLDCGSDVVGLPTFYLLTNVQGITSEDHARRIVVKDMFGRLGLMPEDIDVCAVATSFGAHS